MKLSFLFILLIYKDTGYTGCPNTGYRIYRIYTGYIRIQDIQDVPINMGIEIRLRYDIMECI